MAEIDLLGIDEEAQASQDGIPDDYYSVPKSVAKPRSVNDPEYLGERWTEFFGDGGLYQCATGEPSGMPDELETDRSDEDVEIYQPTKGVLGRDTPFPWQRPGYKGPKQNRLPPMSYDPFGKMNKVHIFGGKTPEENETQQNDQGLGKDESPEKYEHPKKDESPVEYEHPKKDEPLDEDPSGKIQSGAVDFFNLAAPQPDLPKLDVIPPSDQDFPGRPKELVPDYDYCFTHMEPPKTGPGWKWKEWPPDHELKPFGMTVREFRRLWDIFIRIGKDHKPNQAGEENLYEELVFWWRHDPPWTPSSDPDKVNELPIPPWIEELRPKNYVDNPTDQYGKDSKLVRENWKKWKFYRTEDPQRGFDETIAEEQGVDVDAPYTLTPGLVNTFRNILIMIDQRNKVDLEAFKKWLGPEELARMEKGNMTGEDWPGEMSAYD